VLDTIRAPLILRDVRKYGGAVIEQFIYNPILGICFQVLEGMLEMN
jgi:hypothetical protein